jgi:hypothetical protein
MTRHGEAFNAILASVREPIMRQMLELKASTESGGGRDSTFTCESARELAKSCVGLASAYVFKVGDNDKHGTPILGSNQIDNSHIGDYYKACGDLIDKKVVPDTLSAELWKPYNGPGATAGKSCSRKDGSHYLIAKDLSDDDQMACAKGMQREACQLNNAMSAVDQNVVQGKDFGCTKMMASPVSF